MPPRVAPCSANHFNNRHTLEGKDSCVVMTANESICSYLRFRLLRESDSELLLALFPPIVRSPAVQHTDT